MTTDPRVRARLRAATATVRSVLDLARDRNLTYVAAGIAYYAFVSIIPLILLVVAVASFLGGEELVDRVTATVDQAFDELYTATVETSLAEQVRNALVVAFGIGFAVVLVVVTGVVLSTLPLAVPFASLLAEVLLIAVLALAFLPIYYVLPPVDVSLREVIPGTVIAAVGWVVLQTGFRIYASTANSYGAYGLIGAVLLFVTWLYFASVVVLLGGAVNAVRRGVTVPPS